MLCLRAVLISLSFLSLNRKRFRYLFYDTVTPKKVLWFIINLTGNLCHKSQTSFGLLCLNPLTTHLCVMCINSVNYCIYIPNVYTLLQFGLIILGKGIWICLRFIIMLQELCVEQKCGAEKRNDVNDHSDYISYHTTGYF